MGSRASRSKIVKVQSDPLYVDVDETWDRAWQTIDAQKGQKVKDKKVVVKRSGWKTIRIFVSSTFKDFHPEREILVKKVFPDLRVWCETRRLHLIECDLRWGVPKDTTTEFTLRACLGEIDRCYQDNIFPFFVNMTSERIGWIPTGEDIPEAVKDEYKWIEGLSVTEMEIMHGAYRIDNPNALFMLRNPEFLKKVPEEYQKTFVDGSPLAPYKMQMLRKMIKERFPADRICPYDVDYSGYNPDTKAVELTGFDLFSKKDRIAKQYPLPNEKLDKYQQMAEQHESFMKSKCVSVLGRDQILKEIDEYICGTTVDVPLMLIGGAGTGKSSIMARVADDIWTKAANKKIPGGKDWHVFYHFVGAVPGSTELESTLKRLLREINVCDDTNMPTDLDNTAQTACTALGNPYTKPVIVIIDALNQMDEDKAAQFVTWVPKKLGPNVRCVFSMIPDTPQHKSLTGREPEAKSLLVSPLDNESRKAIVEDMLGKYNKRLGESQMSCLLNKTSSENPLWLSIACEELRVFGQFRQISDKINQLSDGLLELEVQVLERFEKENGGTLLIATLCLLEVSNTGLLETELLQILGDEDNLLKKEADKDAGAEKDDSTKEKSEKDRSPLPAYKWSEVYRALRPFLRPFGDSGEGRLDFYHRSLSKAVRRKYFLAPDGEPKEDQYKWWHNKLADFFEHSQNIGRKLEEYPAHLIYIKDEGRLATFLTNWEVFDTLFDQEYSSKLVKYWREGSSFENMESYYITKVNNLANSSISKDDMCRRYEMVSKYLGQSGRFTQAQELLEKAMAIEENELGARPERMVDLYHLTATLADDIMKLEEFMYRSQLPKMLVIINNFNKSVEIRRTMKGDAQKSILATTLNRLAFYYSGYNLRGGDAKLTKEDALEKAIECVDESIKIFDELNDGVHAADALTTKGVVIGKACSEQIKVYKEAEEKLLRLTGGLHHCTDRLYLNTAIYHEEIGDYYAAYSYFRKWHDMCCELYGSTHPRTGRSINALREPMYRRISNEKGHTIPEITS